METYPHGTIVIVIDCANIELSARFWSQVLECDTPHRQSGVYLMLMPCSGGVEILLQEVNDPKHGKNRLHLDLRTPDLYAEVQRVTAIGASVPTDQPFVEHDWTWHVLADPDDNKILHPATA